MSIRLLAVSLILGLALLVTSCAGTTPTASSIGSSATPPPPTVTLGPPTIAALPEPTATAVPPTATLAATETPEPTETFIPPTATPESTELPMPPSDPAALGDTWTRPADGASMIYVPGGSFRMGSTAAQVDDALSLCQQYPDQYGVCKLERFLPESPQHNVTISGFWLDRTEVTNAQYALCVEAGACRQSRLASNPAYNGDDYPVAGVPWQNAVDYCSWVGGQLPTEAQWEFAARGSADLLFPWGDEFDCAGGNFGDDATGCDDGYREPSPAGSFPTGISWCGALDMAGNAWEWVADLYAEYPAEDQRDPTGPESGSERILRGGSWAYLPAMVRAAYRYPVPPTANYLAVGFRCALSPAVDHLPQSPADYQATLELKEKVDVGGHRLYIHCSGTGVPAVILEAGFNDVGATWSQVQPEVARVSRVCSYDRAGLGRSDRVSEPGNSQQAAHQLHTLLENAGIQGPYVLVGHSLGGLYMRLFADRYREQVAGLVLVDSSHPDQYRRSAAVLPPESPDESESVKFYRDWFTTATPDPTLKPELFQAGSLGDLPLAVLTAPNKQRADDVPTELNDKFNQIWVELQVELAQLSSNSTHIIAEESGHFIQHDQPDLVIGAIEQVVQESRAP
jgi:formylglycine-generating enzyme required for sulfatase activity/pimeloyl-ACP methyl ester carboxylesterase